MTPILGIDFGNVIRDNESKTMIPRVKETLLALKSIFEDRIYVVSRIDDEDGGKRNLQYLKDNGFFPGLISSEEKVLFCYKRQDKAPICEDLGITHFVDDRTEVLSHMKTVPNRYALNPTQQQMRDFPPKGMTLCDSWGMVGLRIQSSVKGKPQ